MRANLTTFSYNFLIIIGLMARSVDNLRELYSKKFEELSKLKIPVFEKALSLNVEPHRGPT